MSSKGGAYAYKAVSAVALLSSGVVAGTLLQKAWQAATSGKDGAPDAGDEDRRLYEILAVAAVQGALTGVLRAAITRGGAVGVRRVTGDWPA
ncbi:DUF4235 domain-containing protein [Streptomyces sp. NPDC054784]